MDPELLQASEQLALSVGSALAARPLLERLLGPSFAYVGNAMAELLARYGNRNLHEIFRRSAFKVDPEALDTSQVNARVLRTVIEDGALIEDEVAREYYAGLLASSLAEGGEEDRAVSLLAILRSLSVRQIRAHHAIYSLLRQFYAHAQPQPKAFDGSSAVFVSDDALAQLIGSGSLRTKRYVMLGLSHLDLIERTYGLDERWYDASHNRYFVGLRVIGAPMGAELFLWVHGACDASPEDIFDGELHLVDWSPDDVPQGVLDSQRMLQYLEATELLQSCIFACTQARDNPATIPIFRNKLVNLTRLGATVLPPTEITWFQRQYSITSDRHLEAIDAHLRQCVSILNGDDQRGGGA